MTRLSWDQWFIGMAQYVATRSKDPSTKVGAVITDAKHRVVGVGFNGFARGVKDLALRLSCRETKYKYVVHAEANAILNAARTEDCTLYCTFCPCSACASLIVQSGIKRVVYTKSHSDERWAADQEITRTIFDEAGVKCVNI